jgi:prepilin-type N-terminal cleavage/methylation domain-containing protein
MMKKNNQTGFSMIELLLVVAIVAIVSAIAVPNFLRAKVAAENAAAISDLRRMSSEQVAFYTQRQRYARLDELNAQTNGTLGTWNAPYINRGNYTYSLNPSTPTNAQLVSEYNLIATRSSLLPEPYVFSVDQTGIITQITP